MKVQEAIITRRSTRKYKDIPVPEELIRTILEAGRYAPSGGNSQSNHFFVITDREALSSLEKTVQEQFAQMEVREGMYRSKVSSILQAKKGGYRFAYGAPVLIAIANAKDYDNHMADVVCAVENMLIAANELDLGSCYINQLNWLNENEEILKFFRAHGLKENERIYASLILGYPDTPDGLPERKALPRKGNDVTYI
ncbi:MAG: nitroreductase [Erysipelotrichaceae bacterium]|nr:nitroreductase [Erysipelotrichaceae bacterium]